MSVAAPQKLLEYPPEPTSIEAAIAEGVSWRQEMDEAQWMHGWRYKQIRNKWPTFTLEEYADGVGMPHNHMRKLNRAAQVFEPEHVNLFPGVPITFWAAVSEIGMRDLELALSYIENAYDTPGITYREFVELTRPASTPLRLTPPIKVFGTLRRPAEQTKGKVEFVVQLDPSLQDWDAMLKDSPFFQIPVEVIIRAVRAGSQ